MLYKYVLPSVQDSGSDSHGEWGVDGEHHFTIHHSEPQKLWQNGQHCKYNHPQDQRFICWLFPFLCVLTWNTTASKLFVLIEEFILLLLSFADSKEASHSSGTRQWQAHTSFFTVQPAGQWPIWAETSAWVGLGVRTASSEYHTGTQWSRPHTNVWL